MSFLTSLSFTSFFTFSFRLYIFFASSLFYPSLSFFHIFLSFWSLFLLFSALLHQKRRSVSICLSVCLSLCMPVRTYEFENRLTDFYEIWYWRIYRNTSSLSNSVSNLAAFPSYKAALNFPLTHRHVTHWKVSQLMNKPCTLDTNAHLKRTTPLPPCLSQYSPN